MMNIKGKLFFEVEVNSFIDEGLKSSFFGCFFTIGD